MRIYSASFASPSLQKVFTYSSISPLVKEKSSRTLRGYSNSSCMKLSLSASRVLLGIACTFAAYSGVSAQSLMVGADTDVHGCKPSAGYTWDASTRSCVRPWETPRTFYITVAPQQVACNGVAPMQCLSVREDGGTAYPLYQNIEGFTFVPGITSRLLITSTPVVNPPADGSSVSYKLKRIVHQRPLAGTQWDIVSLNGKAITSGGHIRFTGVRVTGKLCNSFFGTYSLKKDGTFATRGLASTMMWCESDAMEAEQALNLAGARYALNDGQLTLTTRKGDVLVWKLRATK